MTIDLTPDPREEKLPVWVRESMASMRRTIRDLGSTVDAVRGEHPDSNVVLQERNSLKNTGLPVNSQIAFASNWGAITVHHDLDGLVRVQGDSRMLVRLEAANALTVELEDRH